MNLEKPRSLFFSIIHTGLICHTLAQILFRKIHANVFRFGEKYRDIGYQDEHSYTAIPKEILSKIEKREKEEAKEAKERLKDEMAAARASATTLPRGLYNPYKRPWPYGEPLAYSPPVPQQQPVFQPAPPSSPPTWPKYSI